MSEKKKGFWSWLGFGKKDEPTPQEEVKQEEIKEADLGSETQEAETQEAETQEFEVPQIPQESVEEVETTVKPVVESVIESVAEPFIEEVIEEAIEEAEAVEEQAEIQTEVVAEQEIIETAQESQKIEEIAPLVEAAEEVVEKLEEQASEVNSIVYVEDNVEAEENVEAEQIEVEQAETEQAVDFAEKFANDLGVQQVLEAEENQDESEEAEKAEETQNSEESVVTSTSDEYQEKPSTGGFFSRLIQGLIKTKQNIGSGFRSLFRGKKIDDDLFEELEEQLLIADLGMPTTTKIINNLSQHATRKQLSDADALYQLLKEELTAVIKPVSQPLEIDTSKKPYVILMVGVNGVGKTTTIGKLARKFQQEGKSVMLAAGDTFRAAAVEQLQVWGERNGIPVVAQASGADSASVIFDAMQSASAKEIDVLIADTAGRLQNKNNLMDELKKIVRVMKKYDETAPHEIMLTLDAGTGQNAISQAKLFNEAVGLTGITLTKLDGTAKGGVIFAIADQFNLPIRFIGVGEKIEDLRPFNAEEFIEALFTHEDE